MIKIVPTRGDYHLVWCWKTEEL